MQLNQVTTDHKRHVIVIRKQITTSSSITHPIMNTIIILLILTAGTAQAEWQLADKPNQRPDCSFIGNATFDGDMPFEANCKAACDFAHGCNAAHGHEPVQTHEHTCQLLECDDLQNIQWIDVFSFTPRQTWLKDNSQPVDDLAVMALEPLQFHFINMSPYPVANKSLILFTKLQRSRQNPTSIYNIFYFMSISEFLYKHFRCQLSKSINCFST